MNFKVINNKLCYMFGHDWVILQYLPARKLECIRCNLIIEEPIYLKGEL